MFLLLPRWPVIREKIPFYLRNVPENVFVRSEKAVMSRPIIALLCLLVFAGCKKEKKSTKPPLCDIAKIKTENQAKLTISQGVYGTIELITGDCMPSAGGPPSTCERCPAKRVVQLYEYTNISQAVRSTAPPYYYEHFNTQKLAEVESDEKGFYQIDIAPGKYTLVTIEDGKMYVDVYDQSGGINPVVIESNKPLKANLPIDKAVW